MCLDTTQQLELIINLAATESKYYHGYIQTYISLNAIKHGKDLN
jgi:hypothetical protein